MRLTRDVDEQMRNHGADVVLSRDVFDPMTLILELQKLMEKHPVGKRHNPLSESGRLASRSSLTREAEEADSEAIATQIWLDGACRLKEVLTEQRTPSEPQRKKLRKLLGKSQSRDGESQA